MRPTPEIIAAIWDRAKEAEIGLAIKTNSQKALANMLYNHKYTTKDSSLDAFMIFQPNGDELFICRRTAEIPD